MASGGWGGALGAGAWGAAPQPPADEEAPAAPAPAPAKPKFGSSFKANPVAEPTPAPAATPSFGTGAFAGSASVRLALDGAQAGSASGRPLTQAELAKKQKELEAREKALEEREKELGVAVQKKPNWPICLPVWRHNIAEDIPDKSKRVVREAYLCWWFLVGALSYQFFCAAVMLGYKGAGSERIPSWFLTIIYWVAGVPGAIWLWYKRLYSAAQSESTVGYLTFFFMFFLHWAFCVFCAVGPQINAAKWSFSGFLAGIDAFDVSTFAGIIYMIGGGVWSALAVYSMWVLKDAWFFYRGKGGVTQVKEAKQKEQALAAFTQQQQQNGTGNALAAPINNNRL